MEKNKVEIWFLLIVLFFLIIWAGLYFTDNNIHGKPKHFCVEMRLDDVTHSGAELLENESGKHCFESIALRDEFALAIADKYSYKAEPVAENYTFAQNLYK